MGTAKVAGYYCIFARCFGNIFVKVAYVGVGYGGNVATVVNKCLAAGGAVFATALTVAHKVYLLSGVIVA